MMETIIQWNSRGLRANLEEVEMLMKSLTPSALCLQETLLNKQDINFRHCTDYHTAPIVRDSRAHGGFAVFVKKRVPHSQVQVTSVLQTVAVRVSLPDL